MEDHTEGLVRDQLMTFGNIIKKYNIGDVFYIVDGLKPIKTILITKVEIQRVDRPTYQEDLGVCVTFENVHEYDDVQSAVLIPEHNYITGFHAILESAQSSYNDNVHIEIDEENGNHKKRIKFLYDSYIKMES